MTRHALDAGGDRFAIVGIACRLPGGVSDARAFWRQLVAGATGGGVAPAVIDPAPCTLLALAREALEDGGQRPSELAGARVGVFVGASGAMAAMLASEVSRGFELRGPSLVVDTAGSSSLVAVHLACRSLAAGESRLALAGGVAEAAGVVVLKRLAEALRDGDPVRAVIAGSGTVHDGRTPTGEAQIALIREVCHDAGIAPGALQYVEAHGGAPSLRALATALADGREPGSACYVGSVEAVLGQAGAAAGIAGLIKAALCLEHAQIPPQPDPAPDLAPDLAIDPQLPIAVPTRLTDWPEHVGPARAGVHALGDDGTHAHVVLEQAPVDRRPVAPGRPGYNLLPVSARDPAALPARVGALARELAGDPGPAPAVRDAGYTLARRRDHLAARLVFVYGTPADLAAQLARYLAGEPGPQIVTGSRLDPRRRGVAWVFTGAGPAWWAMGRALFAHEPVYREMIERCDRAIARLAGWSLIEELAADEADSHMADPCLAQPASFALQVGLAALCRSLGGPPDAIVGHGAGEIAAFHEAGVYGLDDAIRIAVERGRLYHALSGSGAMLAVELAPAAAAARIAPVAERVAIAAIDGPAQVVLSGDRDALEAIRAALDAERVAARWLPGAIAEHAPAVDRIRDALAAALAEFRPRPAALPLYLTAAEGIAGGPELDAAYWWRNAREPVRFHAAIDRMIDAGCGLFLELGPDPVLGDAIAACLAARGVEGRALAALRRGHDEPRDVLAALAALHVAGRDLAWDQLYPAGRVVPLPAGPGHGDRSAAEPAAVPDEMLGRRLPTATPIWEARLDLARLPYLADHRIAGSPALPAAAYLELAAQAVRALGPAACVVLGDVELRAPLAPGDAPVVQIAIDPDAATLRIASPGAGRDPVLHATAVVRAAPPRLAPPLDVAAVQARAELHRDAAAGYGVLAAFGYPVAPALRAIEELWLSPGEALARVRAPASLGGSAARYHVHPCLLDACFQALLCPETLVPGAAAGERAIRSIAEIRTCPVGDRPLWVHATITARGADEITGDVAIHGEAGESLGALTGVRIALAARPAADTGVADDAGLLDVAWHELPALPDDAPVTGSGAAPGTAAGAPWVILADAHGFGAELARQLEARGGLAWLVRPGPRFSLDRAQRAATIEPGSSADAGALLAAMTPRGEPERCRVVHLWSLDAPALSDASAARLRDAAAHATYSLVIIARALLAWEIAGELSVVTRGAQAVSPGAAVEPAGAPVWGVGRVLRDHELIACRGKLIDLEPGGARSADAARVVRELLAGTGDDSEDELALRGARRFTPRLIRAPGERALPVRLRPDGTYLVTGAFGAIGRAVCRLLVQRGARRLIAMARSKLPPRIAWHALDPAAHPAAPAAGWVRFVRELEALGAEVIAAPIDVTDEPALAGWLAGFRALGYPPIRGVFHAAGRGLDAPVSELDRAVFDAAHDPKVVGAYLLHRHTAGEPLDHFVLLSSIASLVPTGGQAACAAGNAFLDALAHHRRSAGLPGLAVNAPGELATGALGRAVDRALGADRAQVVVAGDVRALVARHPIAPRLLAGLAEVTGGAAPAPVVAIHTDETCFPLTQNQRALWLLDQGAPAGAPDRAAHHIGSAVEIRARLEPELMFAAVRILTRRHPMLRARFTLHGGRPVQRIARDVTADATLLDVRGWAWSDVHDTLLREYRRPFDLEREPLLRFRLLQRGDRRFLLLQVVHPLISDATSTRVFLTELFAVYDALRRGVDPVLPPVRARYLDFLNWQNRLLASPEADRMLRYWTSHLPAELPVLELPADRPPPAVPAHHGASQPFVLDSDLTDRLAGLAHDTGATLFAILLAAYYLLLHRYTGQDELIVGSPVPGRTRDELAATYGCFVNPLPLHVSLAGDPSFVELLARVRAAVQGGLDHQDYPFARLVDELGVAHQPGRSAVFQAMFVLQAGGAVAEPYGFQLDPIELPADDGPCELALSVRPDDAEHALRCALRYSTDRFDAETVRRMAMHYTVLVASLTADPQRPISQLEMLGLAERARIVQRWSGADLAVVPDLPVHAMFRRHAVRRPDALAVIAPGAAGTRILSYGELDAAAAQLARRLGQRGATDGDVVAVCLDRSPELVACLLAILHAGAAYLVVDPAEPDDRIAERIARVGARFVLTASAARLAALPGCTRVIVDDALGDARAPAAHDPAPIAAAADLDRTACVVFASGAPSAPGAGLRAVRIRHHSLASAYHAWDVTYRLRSEARVHLQTAGAALDRFTGDVVRALCSGGALCLAGEPLDPARLHDTMIHHAVDSAELAPAAARGLAAHCEREARRLDFLRLVVVGPGAWTAADHRQLRALLGRRARLLQVYGVPEATIDSAYFEGAVDGMAPGQPVPIGVPFPGSRVFVLDRHGAPVPAGVPGELWLGGNGVAAGYLGDPERTAARFRTVELDDRGPMQLYRTGELARWDARGTLHRCGRTELLDEGEEAITPWRTRTDPDRP